IIILDNNLSSIVKAVLYGRNIFKSIRKFIVLQLTVNLCAVGVTMIGPFIGIDSPVTVIQMLWINIIMDTLGGIAFAGEPPLRSCMKEKPKRRDERILNRYMINQIALLGSFTLAVSLAFLKYEAITSSFSGGEGGPHHLTAFFAFFIFAGVFNCFNARTDRLDLFADISKNRPFLIIMLAISVIQIGFVYLGGDVLRTMPLYFGEMMTALSAALLVFPFEFVRKLIWKLAVHKSGY
ncbi:MAG: cation transporting ATPase C-terminal domain-containing protein, partial [Clostridia bacterium]|nr:cation transporting ATPase C-terminal domain-containing protein [Clostridia bacterium]